MPVERGKTDVLGLMIAMAGGRASELDERRLRLCELVGLSLERLERSIGAVADPVVIRALRGTALCQVQSATLVMVEVSRGFVMGKVDEAVLQRAIGDYEAAWRHALLLAKAQIQDEESIHGSTRN
jgi:hypothetical protein